jgi:hypothetical protein
MAWQIILHNDVEEWLMKLSPDDRAQVVAAVDLLAQEGPSLGRPLVDRIEGSRHHRMKELRPGSSKRSEIRVLFCFDPRRRAILLVAGDKAGDWNRWYARTIPIADSRYDAHLAST